MAVAVAELQELVQTELPTQPLLLPLVVLAVLEAEAGEALYFLLLVVLAESAHFFFTGRKHGCKSFST